MSDSPYIHNVTLENFQTDVIESSFKQPVLVDFWAPWCNPCQTLIPILTQLAEEYNGAFMLAKVNTDEQGELAAQAGVRSLPTVKLFVDGKSVNEFMGALPESEVRKFLSPYIRTESDQVLELAIDAFNEGRQQDALDMLNSALAKDPANARLKINIAKLLTNQNDLESASALVDSLSDEQKSEVEAEVKEIQAHIKLANKLKAMGDPNELRQRLKSNPDDLDAMLKMSDVLSAGGKYEDAIGLLLKIMQKDRNFNDDAGRKGLLEIFELLGSDNPLTRTYRRRMFTLLH
jgi:putative thioredoxin